MTAPAIHIEGALHRAQSLLIDRFAITFAAGGWSALLGASGVGKTSLFRLIAGLPSAALLDGQIAASDGAPIGPRVAMMAQDDQLLPWADALDNIMISARLRGDLLQPDHAAALLSDVGLAGFERRKPAQMSAGQRQRVALARLLYEDRTIVLLDEPFSALDVMTRVATQDLAARLLAGRTVVLITHDPAEAIRLADVAWIATRAGILPCPLPAARPPRPPEAVSTLSSQAALFQRLRLISETGAA
ncbi:ATP-binding cassette domain-containing protein [Pseudorhodobacter aquimaris]|uniref:ATP-binding cassette domain-containing protein n=1 Tax=Pseudorhodobacter aquimaris TaxID=687412 RepID=UPI00067DEBAB|nr:ATP-binding cassette domain-containing protein [Pseudorhodobacter aquimaris]